MPTSESARRGAILIAIARTQLTGSLLGSAAGEAEIDPRREPWLLEPGAVFVTLRRHGALRGCVGSLEASHPLIEDVRSNTIAAATRDPRFPPLEADELAEVRLEISLLSSPEPLEHLDEADALTRLRPGVDGVVLQYGSSRATFLPQVWETLPDPGDFLAQLKKKAGLAADFWSNKIRLECYRVEKWCEAHDLSKPSG